MNPFNIGFFTENELVNFGFKSLGKNVCIAKNCTILGLENISIGSNVRIDGYTTIIASENGFLNLGSFIHIGGYSLLSAGAGITMNDFSGISQGVKIYSKTDDYTGNYLTNPTVSSEYTGVTSGEVILGRHSIIGSGTVILPKVVVGDGSSVGALSLVTKSLPEWGVYFGSPVKRIKERNKKLLMLEREFLLEMSKKE
ncbi:MULTISPECIES: acyltransferase [Pectobacterium]|uniref:acyltransferase n=1 Tax=Pectobacterium TaxID=122277 RepID=UPI0005079D42|nr:MULTISPECIES: acyltransferase [Pectobacterium]KFX01000.1 galactoside O-acetyltransferase [Pectobacterium carotovorum subsp. carotovorum]KML69194.1 galactoside O-acetyltransferase [Pectobacterium carotovorum subsp. carotovorum ICMP 5702]MBA0177909.1 acyltransferase [Pectobacterium carotovorum]MCA6928817.1 acyltransferase [Pectobacterium versatile]MCH5085560.1 acyltransferase [Pectobacterium versatile]